MQVGIMGSDDGVAATSSDVTAGSLTDVAGDSGIDCEVVRGIS